MPRISSWENFNPDGHKRSKKSKRGTTATLVRDDGYESPAPQSIKAKKPRRKATPPFEEGVYGVEVPAFEVPVVEVERARRPYYPVETEL